MFKQKPMITTRWKNSNSWGTRKEKRQRKPQQKTERTSLWSTKDEQAWCNVESVCDGTTSNYILSGNFPYITLNTHFLKNFSVYYSQMEWSQEVFCMILQ